MNRRASPLWLLASLAACADATSTLPTPALDDASTDLVAADGATPDVAPPDVAPPDVAPPDAAGDGGACVANDAGMLQRNYYCDFGAIHVLQREGGAAEVQVEARVGSSGASCGVVDSIEVLRGATGLQRFDVGRSFVPGSMGAALGRAPAAPALVSECANETTRLSAYGIIVRGRDAIGPFEARCGTSASGSRWPPGAHLACHRNLEQPPMGTASSQIVIMPVGPTSAARFFVAIPHAAGMPAVTTLSGTLRVVSPQYAAFASGPTLMSVDSTGWTGSAGEAGAPMPATQLQMYATGATTLPMGLCPPPVNPMPGVIPMPPPSFLARLTGMGPRGAVTIEAIASCVTYTRP